MEKPDVQDDTRAGQDAPAAVLRLASGVTLALVRAPAGEFLMGGTEAEVEQVFAAASQAYAKGERDRLTPERRAWFTRELPQHPVQLAAYLMGQHPVTVAQFAAFVQASGYRTTAEKEGSGHTWTGREWKDVQGADWQRPRGPDSDVKSKADHPVTQVSWHDALAFCTWASQATGRTVRLPSEAEWEKAARGTDARLYPWGTQAPDGTRCNFNMEVTDTTPVGKYSPAGDSPYGCADMAGNVWEWTGSLFQAYPYRPDDDREDISGSRPRVVRGGSWFIFHRRVRCSYRDWHYPLCRDSDLGFRVCASPI